MDDMYVGIQYIHISIVCMFGPRSLQNQVDSLFFKYDYALLNARRRLSCRTESTCMFLSQAITSSMASTCINLNISLVIAVLVLVPILRPLF